MERDELEFKGVAVPCTSGWEWPMGEAQRLRFLAQNDMMDLPDPWFMAIGPHRSKLGCRKVKHGDSN